MRIETKINFLNPKIWFRYLCRKKLESPCGNGIKRFKTLKEAEEYILSKTEPKKQIVKENISNFELLSTKNILYNFELLFNYIIKNNNTNKTKRFKTVKELDEYLDSTNKEDRNDVLEPQNKNSNIIENKKNK